MSKKLIYLMSIVLVLWLSVGVASAQPLNQSSGPDGIVSVEAEHFDANVEVGGHAWVETGPTGGFTGELGMWAPNGQGSGPEWHWMGGIWAKRWLYRRPRYGGPQ